MTPEQLHAADDVVRAYRKDMEEVAADGGPYEITSELWDALDTLSEVWPR